MMHMLTQDPEMAELGTPEANRDRQAFERHQRDDQFGILLGLSEAELTSYFAFKKVLHIDEQCINIQDDAARARYWQEVQEFNVLAIRKARAEAAIERLGWTDLKEARNNPPPRVPTPRNPTPPPAPAPINQELLAEAVSTSVQDKLEPLLTRELVNMSKVIEGNLKKMIEDGIKAGMKKRKREDDEEDKAQLPTKKPQIAIATHASSLL